MSRKVVKVEELSAGEVPKELKWEHYFDFEAHPFEHRGLFEAVKNGSVIGALAEIDGYARKWLKEKTEGGWKGAREAQGFGGTVTGKVRVLVEEGAEFAPTAVIGGKEPGTVMVGAGSRVTGCALWVDRGDIAIGGGTRVEPGAGIKGPCIIGSQCEVRQGTYFRGDVITGDRGTFRGEVKNTVMMDEATFPHPGYVGDSLCGYRTHFGNQATSANLGIYYHVGGKGNVTVEIGGVTYDLGRAKVGIVMGDHAQVGCNSVSDPGTFLGPRTIVYALSRINKGFYGPDEVLKNKPMEHGVIERTKFKRPG